MPDIVSASDYSSFGVSLLGRQLNTANVEYGFNGKWNEIETGYQNYGMRDYDAKARRFASVDPLTKKYPELTPYQFASNTPLQAVDLDGKEAFFVHGTASYPKRWTENAQTIPTILKYTNNKTIDANFSWEDKSCILCMHEPGTSSITNNELDRHIAAINLALYVFEKHKAHPDEEITLVGHSHGGNVAIQAAPYIYKLTGQRVNILTIGTPAYNGKGDQENPETQKPYINDHIALWNYYDGVSGGLAGHDYYTNPTVTTNIELDHTRLATYYKKFSKKSIYSTDNINAHSVDVEHPELLLNEFENPYKKLKPVQGQASNSNNQNTPTNATQAGGTH